MALTVTYPKSAWFKFVENIVRDAETWKILTDYQKDFIYKEYYKVMDSYT